jgi:hypothetical protein
MKPNRLGLAVLALLFVSALAPLSVSAAPPTCDDVCNCSKPCTWVCYLGPGLPRATCGTFWEPECVGSPSCTHLARIPAVSTATASSGEAEFLSTLSSGAAPALASAPVSKAP